MNYSEALEAARPNCYSPDGYRAKILSWRDGDTVRFSVVDLGFHHFIVDPNPYTAKHEPSWRVWGINAHDLGTQAGMDAWLKAQELAPPLTEVRIITHGQDDFGRWLVSITLPDGRDFGAAMLEANQAVLDLP